MVKSMKKIFPFKQPKHTISPNNMLPIELLAEYNKPLNLYRFSYRPTYKKEEKYKYNNNEEEEQSHRVRRNTEKKMLVLLKKRKYCHE